MFAWGIAQGLVKKYVGEVPPARFCLYYAIANALVNVGYWAVYGEAGVWSADHREFATLAILAYVLDGIAWIFYYQSIVHGPISIVGTLSAAYPAMTPLFARLVLNEQLVTWQYLGIALVIAGCLGLAYEPPGSSAKETRARWIPFAGAALLIWSVNGVIIKLAYGKPGASDGNMALFIAIGGMATLGVYGVLRGRQGATKGMARSFLPMATMALGSLLAAIAYKSGKASIVTPISGAYPIVTVPFAAIILRERPPLLHWGCIAGVLVGMVLTTTFAPE
jgi:drug/metabolite transporter (DMT)-like permease